MSSHNWYRRRCRAAQDSHLLVRWFGRRPSSGLPAALLREGSISVKFCSVDTRGFFQKGNLRRRTERAGPIAIAGTSARIIAVTPAVLAALLGFTAGGESR